jgi:hypothetical protein
VKLRIAREGNGLLGLYWLGQGVNHIALNITHGFGLRLEFKPTKQQTRKIANTLLDRMDTRKRLKALSDEELIEAVLSTEAGDDELVIEMVERLCPDWLELLEEMAPQP